MPLDDRRFSSRARALAVLRLPFLAGAAVLLGSFDPSSSSFSLLVVASVAAAASAAAHALLLRRLASGPRRLATLASLCVDAAVFTAWAAETGGLRSPLLPIQLLLTGMLALLYPRPAAAIPPVASLAALAWIHRLGEGGHLYDLAVLGLYGALHLVLTYLLTYFHGRESALLEERDRLSAALGASEERLRLSRDLHDGVGGSVAALVLQAQVLAAQAEGPARERGRHLLETASEALSELRGSLRLLRGEFDLLSAAERHCARLGASTGLEVRFVGGGTPCDLPPEDQLSVFRILQEALVNVVRHARARKVEVSFASGDGGAVLEVRDDGVGFEGAPREGSYGLRGFEERARGLGGTLAVESRLGEGTIVRLEVPRKKSETMK